MKYHIIGGSSPADASSQRESTSLAVLQWMELVRGERQVATPSHSFQVETMQAEEHYCLRCFGVRWSDVMRDAKKQVLLKRCRCCGKESGG